MSDKGKPEITATIKFRGVTIEGMTVQELKELRDVLNTLVGEPQRVVERVIERHDYIYPYRPYLTYGGPTWAVSGNTSAGNTLTINDGVSSQSYLSDMGDERGAHYTISLAN